MTSQYTLLQTRFFSFVCAANRNVICLHISHRNNYRSFVALITKNNMYFHDVRHFSDKFLSKMVKYFPLKTSHVNI